MSLLTMIDLADAVSIDQIDKGVEFDAVNIYIGGAGSAGKNWEDPAILSSYAKAGKKGHPTYVPNQDWAANDAQADSQDILDCLKKFGFQDCVVSIDVEEPSDMNTFNITALRNYLSVMIDALHKDSYRVQIYSGDKILTALAVPGGGFTPPDAIWLASWTQSQPIYDLNIAKLPGLADYMWDQPGQRAWQYLGNWGNPQIDVSVIEPELVTDIPNVEASITMAPAQPAPKPAPQTFLTYTVKAGDTLGSIAQRYGSSVSEIQNVNHIQDVNLIYPGQRLEIPKAGNKVTQYVVENGDTLSKIAQHFSIPEAELYNANATQLNNEATARGFSNSNDGSIIFPGTILSIP